VKFLSFFKKSLSLTDPSLFATLPTASGIAVTPTSALGVPAVAASVRVIAEPVASLPLHVFNRRDDVKERDTSNPLYGLLHDLPNAWSSSYDLRLQMQTDCLLTGNAYAFVNRVGGIARELIRLVPGSVSVAMGDGGPIYTVRQTNGTARTYPFTDIIHIRALSTDGLVGIAPIQMAREPIALALALEAPAARLMANAARPSGILKIKAKLDKDALQRLKSSWNAGFTQGAAGGTAVFDSDVDFSPLSFNSVDMQFIELRRFQLEEISRAFRVPPHLLSELGRATWGNASEMGQAFLDYCLLPWLIQWQGALTRTLLSPDQRANTFIEFDTAALTRANLTARTEAYAKSVGGPFLTANEARALENRAPIDGGDKLNHGNDNISQPAKAAT
jgi:HK97 family phage portal protein